MSSLARKTVFTMPSCLQITARIYHSRSKSSFCNGVHMKTCFKTCDMRKDLKFINLTHYFLGFINELSSNTLDIEMLRNYLTNPKGRFVLDLLSKDDISPFLCYPFLFLILRAKEATSKISFQASNLTHV